MQIFHYTVIKTNTVSKMQNFNDTVNKTIKFKMSLHSFNNSNTKHRCENITKVYIKNKCNITVQNFYYNFFFT